MGNNIKSESNQLGSKKETGIIYGIAVFLVLAISLLPKINYIDPWNKAYALIDESQKANNPIESQKLLDSGGRGLIACLNEHPYHGRLHLMAGYYYFLKDNMDSTIYHQIKALEVGSGGYVNSLEFQARGLLAEATIKKGATLLNLSDTNALINLYLNTVKYTPQDSIINNNLAIFYLNAKLPDSAIPYFKNALTLRKNNKGVFLDLAKFYYLKKMADSVEYYANSTLKLDPSNTDAINLLNYIKK